MSLDLAEFRHLCRLARLEPDASVQEQLVSQCGGIIAYMDKLSELDTSGVEPLYSPVASLSEACRPWREDVASDRLSRLTRKDVLANAPDTDGAFFIVPRIVEGK